MELDWIEVSELLLLCSFSSALGYGGDMFIISLEGEILMSIS